MTRHTFTVVGTPAPQGSKRHVGGGILVESSTKVRPWREAIKWAVVDSGIPPTTGAVKLELRFYLTRPQSHYRTGRYAGAVKPSAPLWPAVRPDLDKLARSTLDGLVDARLIADDSRVVILNLSKWYTRDAPRCEVIIREAE